MPRDYRDMNRNFGGSRSVKILVSVLAFALLALSACKKDTEGEQVTSEELAEFLAEETGGEFPAGAKYKFEGSKCCLPVVAVSPTPPLTQKHCAGRVWDNVAPFACIQRETGFCLTGFDTLVTLQQYRYQWDAARKRCTLAPTGKEKELEKKNCGGSMCQ